MKFYFLLSVILLSSICFATEVFTTPGFPVDFFTDYDTMYISTYTFTNKEIASLLNKNTILIVDNSPVGGIPNKELLCSIPGKVFLYSGPRNYLHAKYAIKNNSSTLITSENFGSFQNRGWGAIINETDEFMSIFLEDLGNSVPLECEETYELDISNIQSYKTTFFPNQKVIPITDNYEQTLLSLIDSANESILIEQFYIHKYWNGKLSPLIEALLKKDVEIRVLLDNTWYNQEKNKETIDYLTTHGIEARFVDNVDFERLHVKGMIIDNKIVLISSINWNENSVRRNREAGVIIEGEAANFFTDAFEKDWSFSNEKQKVSTDTLIFIFVISTAWILARRK